MPVFFENSGLTKTAVTQAMTAALNAPAATPGDAKAQAERRVEELVPANNGFQSLRFISAVAVLMVFVAAAVGTDIGGYDDSSKALYGFATTILGVIVGLLAGEKSS